MAIRTAELLTSGRPYQAAEEFAILESFLVHARNLHDFFKSRSESVITDRATNPGSRHSGSVWALDFVPGFGVDTYEREVIQKINRWLQHLTTWRQEEQEHPRWQPSMIVNIYESMDKFLAMLDDEFKLRLRGPHDLATQLLRTAGLIA